MQQDILLSVFNNNRYDVLVVKYSGLYVNCVRNVKYVKCKKRMKNLLTVVRKYYII